MPECQVPPCHIFFTKNIQNFEVEHLHKFEQGHHTAVVIYQLQGCVHNVICVCQVLAADASRT